MCTIFLFSVGEEIEQLSLTSVSTTLKAFIECSTLGEFHTRLTMLLNFHCHLLLVPNQPGQGTRQCHYFQYNECIFLLIQYSCGPSTLG